MWYSSTYRTGLLGAGGCGFEEFVVLAAGARQRQVSYLFFLEEESSRWRRRRIGLLTDPGNTRGGVVGLDFREAVLPLPRSQRGQCEVGRALESRCEHVSVPCESELLAVPCHGCDGRCKDGHGLLGGVDVSCQLQRLVRGDGCRSNQVWTLYEDYYIISLLAMPCHILRRPNRHNWTHQYYSLDTTGRSPGSVPRRRRRPGDRGGRPGRHLRGRPPSCRWCPRS